MDLHELYQERGQSIWLDYIRRHLLTSGELTRLVEAGLRGVTSNPTIFEKAIAGSTDYEDAIARFGGTPDTQPGAIYEQLAIEDIQTAADILRPVYDGADRADGFVCLEVSPLLARNTAGTIAEARRLWQAVARPNIMIKVPGTAEGIPAIRQLIGEGINVNVTLLFSRGVCEQVFDAYVDGLELLVARGEDVTQIASVASVFVSRVDTLVNRLLEAPQPDRPAEADARRQLVGKVGIANAKLIYRAWQARIRSPRWQQLAQRGARVQRMLWASTSAKDPRMADLAYVEALIGPDTVDTLPPATLDAFRSHGTAESLLERDVDAASQVMASLAEVGISIDDVTRRLVDEGVESFAKAFDGLMTTLAQKRAQLSRSGAASSRPAH